MNVKLPVVIGLLLGTLGFAPGRQEVVVCQNQTFDGYTQKLIISDPGPATKIVRNCTFKNSNQIAIVIRGASNVLIEDSHFENIRSHITGVGAAFGVYFGCQGSPCPIRNVTIRNNTFVDIGADGMQIGDQSRDIQNVLIEGNTFYVTNADVGENGVDIKGVDGPIVVRGNVFHGFRPCESATQDCTGSAGVGMVVHSGSAAGAPQNVTIESNEFYDNTLGLRVSDTTNVVIRNNNFHDNQKQPVTVSGTTNCTHGGDVFVNNGQPPDWGGCVQVSGPSATPGPSNTPIAPTATRTATPNLPTATPTGAAPTPQVFANCIVTVYRQSPPDYRVTCS